MKKRSAAGFLAFAALGFAAWQFGWIHRLLPPSRLAAGTPVAAVLLTELTAGESKVDSQVYLAAVEPVLAADGRLLIEKGAVIEGRLATSRAGGLLERMAGSEPLLEVELCRVQAADGSWIAVSGPQDPDRPVKVPLPRPSIDLASAAGDLIAKAQDSDLARAARKGWSMDDLKSVDWIAQVKRAAKSLDLPRAQAATSEALRKAREGLDRAGRGDFSDLKGADLAEAAGLWRDVEASARKAGSKAEEVLKGPERRAGAGTPVRFATAEPAEIRAR